MTSINEKMGFKRPGRRSMMKLPASRAAAADLTAAQCPSCQRRGVRETILKDTRVRFCGWCGTMWRPEG